MAKQWVDLYLLLLVTFMQLKIENKVVTPLQPKFYRGYVDGVFKRCKENVKDIFFFQVS